MDTAHSFIFIFEIIAFIFSIYFYKTNKTRIALYLMLFLGFTALVDSIGNYTNYLDDFGFLTKLKGTVFEKNFWLFNIYLIISYLFYTFYFKWNLKSNKTKYFLNIASIIFLFSSVFVLIFYNFLFNSYSLFTLISGTCLVLISVFLYYFDLLKSEGLLNLKKSLIFYVSIGVLIFNLCLTPVFIFSVFLKVNNPEFVTVYKVLLIAGNYILYSSFIVGFLVCAKKKVKLKPL